MEASPLHTAAPNYQCIRIINLFLGFAKSFVVFRPPSPPHLDAGCGLMPNHAGDQQEGQRPGAEALRQISAGSYIVPPLLSEFP